MPPERGIDRVALAAIVLAVAGLFSVFFLIGAFGSAVVVLTRERDRREPRRRAVFALVIGVIVLALRVVLSFR